MADLPLTAFDVAVLLVIVLSVLISLMRGLTRDALGLAGWIAAIAIAWYGFGYARELARQTIETDWLADLAALGVVFLMPLIAFKLIAAMIADRLPGGSIGFLDRALGVAFGAARGALIVSAAYLALTMTLTPDEQPDWIRGARVLPYVQEGAGLLQRFVPGTLAERTRGAARPGETWNELSRRATELTAE